MAATIKDTDLLTSIAAGNQLQSAYSVAGRSTVLIGNCTSTYESIDLTSMLAVGATDGTVSMGNNQEIVKLQSSAMVNPYAVIPTAYDFQVSLVLQEVDIPNIAVALSLGSHASDITTTVASATAESTITDNPWLTVMATQASTTDTDATVTQTAHGLKIGDVVRFDLSSDEVKTVDSVTDVNTWEADSVLNETSGTVSVYKHGFANYYDIDPATPSDLFSMRIITLAPQQTEGTVAYYAWDFFKVQIVSQGTIDFDRTAAVTIPITAHCLGNDHDVVGRLWHTDTLTYRGYPS